MLLAGAPTETAQDQFSDIFGPGRGGGRRSKIAGTYDLTGEDSWYAWDMVAVITEDGNTFEQTTVVFYERKGNKLVGTVSLQYIYDMLRVPSGTALPGGSVVLGALRQLQTLIA